MSVVIDSDNNNVTIVEEAINVTISTGGSDVSAVWGNVTGDIQEQTDLIELLDDKVPYTGATGDVNLGEYGIQLGNLEFDNTPTNVPTAAGSVYWSDTDGTLNMVLKGGQTISRIGETQHIRALNNTGAQIARGKVVYVVGAQGQRLTIALADADTEILSKDTIGITSEDIADGAEGFVIVQGVINNVNTNGMNDGATVYLSHTAGSYTTTPPVDPAHLVILGFIVNGNSGGAGSIYVKVDNGYELGELHDVNTTGATNGQVLTYNGTTWVPATNGSGTVTSIATSAPITGGTITSSGTIGITQAGAAADGYLSSTDWTTFNNKQAALTNPITGTGTAGQVAYWSGTGTQTGSQDFTWNDTTKILSFSNGGTLINEIRISSVNSNTMMGRLAGSSASLTGGSNSFFGQNSGSANTTGNGNSAFGLRSGNNNTTGSGNVFFGSQAGRYLADGTTSLTVTNNSVFLGFDTRAAADSQTNQIAIGYQAIGLGSNTTVIGNSSTTQTWLGGNLTLGTTTSGGRLTVRGSGTTSATTALLVQNSTPANLLTVTDDGRTAFGSSASSVQVYPSGVSDNTLIGGDSLTFNVRGNINSLTHGGVTFSGDTSAITSGNHNVVAITKPFSPTSGSAGFRYLSISPVINQTGGANGITRGLYVNPTLTSAADWRSVEFSNNTGWGLYGAGTANNYLGGSLGIGTTSLNNSALNVLKTITGSTVVNSIINNSPIASDVTTEAAYYSTNANTLAASFTLTFLEHFAARQSTFGLGSTVTNQYGFFASSGLTGATNNYGFYGNIASGTGRWNLYMNGTADNYLAGSLGIGTTSLSNSALAIQRNITGTNSVISVNNTSVVQSDVTSVARYFATNATTQAATFNLGLLIHYSAGQSVFGLNSTVTNQYGYFVSSGLTGATNNFAFRGELASAANNWNLYMSGTAANYLAGNTSIGTTTSSGRLTVRGAGTTSATNGLLVEDSGGTDTFTIRDDGGFAFKGGTVGLAQTGYTTFTNLTTDRTCDANATTVEELADILGTLIEDLKTKGIISA